MIRLRFAAELVADCGEPEPTPAAEPPSKTLPIRSDPPVPLDSFAFPTPGGEYEVRVERFGAEALESVRKSYPGQVRIDWQGNAVVVRFFEAVG
jgi:hypothetical protein